MELLIGTNNEGKVIEISEVLAELPLIIRSPIDLGIHKSPEETGDAFLKNAVQKAEFYSNLTGLPTIADDSGIIVDALKDELGIHTRRWGAGPKATDDEWITYFLERMSKEENKRARFHCTLAYIDQMKDLHIFEGSCEGTITESLEADYLPGLPISACFKPDSHSAVFSALSLEQKNSTSHRGKAVHAFADFLKNSLST